MRLSNIPRLMRWSTPNQAYVSTEVAWDVFVRSGVGGWGRTSVPLSLCLALSPFFSLMWTTDDPGMCDPPGIRVCWSLWVWNTAICHRAHSYTRQKATSFVDLNGELNFPRTSMTLAPPPPMQYCLWANGNEAYFKGFPLPHDDGSPSHNMAVCLWILGVWEHLLSWLVEC